MAILHHREPQVYRYTDEEYVDAFIKDGQLRLGAYDLYRNGDHPEIHDQREGHSRIDAFIDNGFFSTRTHIEDTAYMLCTSTLHSSELRNAFNATSCFVISDVRKFALEISKKVPNCHTVLFGACNYNNIITRCFPHIDGNLLNGKTKEEVRAFSKEIFKEVVGVEPYFHKSVGHIHHNEYRFVFITDRPADEYITVNSKAATQYCMKHNF